MKIQLSPAAIELILSAAQYTDKKMGGSNAISIHAHILIDLKANGLLSVSSVSDGRFHTSLCKIDGEFQPGVAAIKADKFSSLLSCLPDGSHATLTVSDSTAQLTCGRSRYKLSITDPVGFPRMPKMEQMDAEIELPSTLLQQGLERVVKSMSNTDVRAYLEAVCVEVRPNEVVFVATDGHRLSFESFQHSNQVSENARVLIPRKRVFDLLAVLRKSSTNVRVRFNSQAARVYSTDLKWIFQFSLLEARYPDYQRAIPSVDTMPILKLDRVEFISALERIGHIVSKSKNPSCVIRANGADIHISAKGESEDTGEEQVSNRNTVENVTSSFNINYLLDALKKLDDDVVDLRMTGSTPCHLSGENQKNAFHVVMPVRI